MQNRRSEHFRRNLFPARFFRILLGWGAITGYVSGNSNSKLNINFTPNSQPYTFTNANGTGSFTLIANDIIGREGARPARSPATSVTRQFRRQRCRDSGTR